MLEEIVEELSEDDELPFKHKVGKLIVGGIIGLIATELAKKAYMAVLVALQERQS